MNPIKKAYEKFDDAIMSGVNKSVRAWNWTTGRTKSDLAKVINHTSNITACADFILYFPPTAAFIFFPFYFIDSYISTKKWDKIEEQEINALQKGCKDIEVEIGKKDLERRGFMDLLTGSGVGSVGLIYGNKYDYFNYILGTAVIVRAFSHYIMRADSLPPRKSAFSRAKDKLSEKLSSPQTEPVSVPAEANRNNDYSQRLEDYLI